MKIKCPVCIDSKCKYCGGKGYTYEFDSVKQLYMELESQDIDPNSKFIVPRKYIKDEYFSTRRGH